MSAAPRHFVKQPLTAVACCLPFPLTYPARPGHRQAQLHARHQDGAPGAAQAGHTRRVPLCPAPRLPGVVHLGAGHPGPAGQSNLPAAILLRGEKEGHACTLPPFPPPAPQGRSASMEKALLLPGRLTHLMPPDAPGRLTHGGCCPADAPLLRRAHCIRGVAAGQLLWRAVQSVQSQDAHLDPGNKVAPTVLSDIVTSSAIWKWDTSIHTAMQQAHLITDFTTA